mmetsp:Transcript_12604/g.17525  ORF Transcript_12604/g.17525 Transcript_12604/m.17525 type:complete len:124 (+) Transcript_12604:297-668(+)
MNRKEGKLSDQIALINDHVCNQFEMKKLARIKSIGVFMAVMMCNGIAVKAMLIFWQYWVLCTISGSIAILCTCWLTFTVVSGDCKEAFFAPEIYTGRCNHWLEKYGVHFDPVSKRLILNDNYR